ncbi:MAG: aldo/keto reductase [Anaerolineaceae bacterium]|nr:MAG: aldo/keto reductase [Anaerolineaceae bacterium]
MFKRRLGRSDIEVSALGLGCWAMGGPWEWLEKDGSKSPSGWSGVNDAESIRAIHYALDMGINFFDTAANYGCGHSERVLAKALTKRRDKVIVATKFGYLVDETNKTVTETDEVVARIRQECDDSLRRLNTDYIDLYQFHVDDYPAEKAGEVRDVLESLVKDGKIRWYGWSTDNPEGARAFAQGPHCTAIQHWLNMIGGVTEILTLCDELDQASINRSPLAMGTLTGKFTSDTTFPEDDVRHIWDMHRERPTLNRRRVSEVREYFTGIGDLRTLSQIALAWIWTRHPRTIPIPGFRTLAQVKENIAAMDFGLLNDEQMKKIDEIFGRTQ